jgi:ribonuclease HI
MIVIYTDGASKGNPGPGGWGAVVSYQKPSSGEKGIKNQEWVTEIGGHEEHTTNNRMELTAAIEVFKYIDSLSKVIIHGSVLVYTDSEYLMKGITQWIHSWQEKGWKTAGKKPVLNQDLWQTLLILTDGKDLRWKYVAGHSGEKYNERADEVATSFADGINPHLYDGPKEKYR